MVREIRDSTATRAFFVALTMLALAFRLIFPPGYMPGNSLSEPIMLCSGQGPMPGMAMAGVMMPGMASGDRHHPGQAPHGTSDHDCPFAGLGATPTTPLPPVVVANVLRPMPTVFTSRVAASSPGRGLAAPPPPSHAPPQLRA